jgi:hypothetical protein
MIECKRMSNHPASEMMCCNACVSLRCYYLLLTIVFDDSISNYAA